MGRFSVKFPNNAFAKYADHSKVFFSRILNERTRETEYFYFPILLEENKKKYHVILKYQEMRTIGIKTFNPFDDIMDDMSEFAKAILTDLKNSCILHIREERILIEFIEDKLVFAYEQTSKEFYKMVLGKMYEDFAHETLTKDELIQVCSDFELYIKTNEIAEGEDVNSDKYAFHTLFPNNAFSKGIISKGQKTKYMCKIMDIKNKQHVKWHYLPLAVVSNDKTYNALIATTF